MKDGKFIKVILDEFVYKEFDSSKSKFYINYPIKDFENKLNEIIVNDKPELRNGYADFCKHIFIKNFVKGFKPKCLEINEETSKLIKTSYDARRETELPVLIRYIPIESIDINKIEDAKLIDIILYSKEQVLLEMKDMKEDENKIKEMEKKDFDYGVVGIKAQNVDYELPMMPITMMRNALGTEEGGSGIKLDRKKYKESVDYWSKYVMIK